MLKNAPIRDARHPSNLPPSHRLVGVMLGGAMSSKLNLNSAVERTSPRLLAMKAVVERTTLSKPQIYKLVKEGKFPRPISVSEARKAFLSHEVEEWIDQRIASSRGTGA